MKKIILAAFFSFPGVASAALCDPLTDAQYRTEIVRIVSTNLQPADLEEQQLYSVVMVRKAIRYKNAGGSTEDTASRCFLKDLYKDITGRNVTASEIHSIKHFIGQNFPGQEFEP